MQKEILQNAEITVNSEQITKLKDLFPNAFDKNGRFMPHKLEEFVRADEVDVTREGYKLDWLGKSYARLLANLKTETLLTENAEHNAKPENVNSQNMLIQGDNLDVLKHLVNAYSEKVKMIYIDPPYNTGSDGFVYNDNRKFTADKLARLAGIDEDEAKHILDFTQSKSNSHSAWLTFMYPRLYIARELLRDDGVIFISIDDNEQAQLKLLCNEVFGEENFVGNIAWESKTKTQNTNSSFNKLQPKIEHLFLYTKRDKRRFNLIQKGKKDYPHDDQQGVFRWHKMEPMTASGVRGRETMVYPILGMMPPPEKQWQLGSEKIQPLIAKNDVKLDGGLPYIKMRPNMERLAITEPFWGFFSKEIGTAETAKTELTSLVKNHGFETVKPLNLIKRLTLHSTEDNDTILDFFAGSGTTAHAVMQLNAEDGGNREYICVQLDESTDRKAGYNTIFEITRKRIICAAKKIQEEHPEAQCDFGFKEFKTTPANEGQFKGYLDDADTMEDYVPFNGMALDEDARHALLTTWKTYDGLPLTEPLQEVDLGGYVAYQGGDKLYFINHGLAMKHIIEMLNRLDEDDGFAPRKLVAFHHMFNDKDLREFSEAVNARNRKDLELDFIQRF